MAKSLSPGSKTAERRPKTDGPPSSSIPAVARAPAINSLAGGHGWKPTLGVREGGVGCAVAGSAGIRETCGDHAARRVVEVLCVVEWKGVANGLLCLADERCCSWPGYR